MMTRNRVMYRRKEEKEEQGKKKQAPIDLRPASTNGHTYFV
jgi:hypothetical protein